MTSNSKLTRNELIQSLFAIARAYRHRDEQKVNELAKAEWKYTEIVISSSSPSSDPGMFKPEESFEDLMNCTV